MEVALGGGSFLTSSSISGPLRDRCTPWAMRFPDMSRQPLRLQAAVVTAAPHWRQGTAQSASRMPPLTSKRSEEHTSELQSRLHLVCRLLLEKKKRTLTARHAALPCPP